MKVILAESAGFCFGVQRAVDVVKKQIKEGSKPLYTYGPIIHNEEVVREFEENGVQVMEEDHIDDYPSGDVLSYALFPKVATEFFEYREAQQTKVDPAKADKENKAYPV